MQLRITRPTAEDRNQVRERAELEGCNVEKEWVGITKNAPPWPGTFPVDKYRIRQQSGRLGSGERIYRKAVDCLQKWEQFQLGWAEVDPNTEIQVGKGVCVTAKSFLVWTLNPLRIAYVDKGCHEGKHYYAYGHTTQRGHMLAGEEKFQLEWDVAKGDVTYEILSFSRPDNWLSTITYPAVQYLQSKFAKDSIAKMQQAMEF